MHWKMFSSTPGLYLLEANSGRCQHIQNIQINKVVKMKKVSFILQKKLNRLLANPIVFALYLQTTGLNREPGKR